MRFCIAYLVCPKEKAERSSNMSTTTSLLILLACSPLLVLVLQMVATRVNALMGRGTSAQAIALGCAIVGNIPMAIAIWVVALRRLTTTPSDPVWTGIYSLVVYNALAYSYFHVFNMGETSRRIRVLSEICASKQLKASEISSIYGASKILDLRLERLLSMSQIKRSGNRYLLDNKLLYYAARVVEAWGHLLGFPSLLAGYNKAKNKNS